MYSQQTFNLDETDVIKFAARNKAYDFKCMYDNTIIEEAEADTFLSIKLLKHILEEMH